MLDASNMLIGESGKPWRSEILFIVTNIQCYTSTTHARVG